MLWILEQTVPSLSLGLELLSYPFLSSIPDPKRQSKIPSYACHNFWKPRNRMPRSYLIAIPTGDQKWLSSGIMPLSIADERRNARLIVVGFPELCPTCSSCLSRRSCFLVSLISFTASNGQRQRKRSGFFPFLTAPKCWISVPCGKKRR